MPALREARNCLVMAQRDAQRRLRSLAGAEMDVALARAGRGSAGPLSKARSALAEAKAMLRAALATETAAQRKLAAVIAAEAAQFAAETREQALSLFKAKQVQKTEADLQKAVARFSAAWSKRRSKADAGKLAKMSRKLVRKETQSVRKASATASGELAKALALSRARAKMARDKLRARAARLNIRL